MAFNPGDNIWTVSSDGSIDEVAVDRVTPTRVYSPDAAYGWSGVHPNSYLPIERIRDQPWIDYNTHQARAHPGTSHFSRRSVAIRQAHLNIEKAIAKAQDDLDSLKESQRLLPPVLSC